MRITWLILVLLAGICTVSGCCSPERRYTIDEIRQAIQELDLDNRARMCKPARQLTAPNRRPVVVD